MVCQLVVPAQTEVERATMIAAGTRGVAPPCGLKLHPLIHRKSHWQQGDA